MIWRIQQYELNSARDMKGKAILAKFNSETTIHKELIFINSDLHLIMAEIFSYL